MMTFGEQLEHKGKLKVAKNMLAAGADLAFIKQVTELSDEEIAALVEQH